MRAYLFLLGATLLVGSPAALSAQEASSAPPTSTAAPPAVAVPAPEPAQPASTASVATASPAAPGAQPAVNKQKVACDYTTHEGMLISLNHCGSVAEADRRRKDQQQQVRQFQLNSLTYFGPRP